MHKARAGKKRREFQHCTTAVFVLLEMGWVGSGGSYNISDSPLLNQLINKDHEIDQEKITSDCAKGYAFLTEMTEEEKTLAADEHEKEKTLWGKLRNEIQDTDS